MFRRASRAVAAIAVTSMIAVVAIAPAAPAAPGRAAGATPAAPAAPGPDAGLFGAQDPTFDGVLRQATALIGLVAIGQRPPRAALRWLVDQQCPDGSFAAYRADVTAPCPEPDPAAFTGKDTNATALAAIALSLLGRDARAAAAGDWLLGQQTPEGTWPWIPGGEPDTASTGWAVAALRTVAGPAARPSITEGQRYLRRAVIGCAAPVTERFGLPFYPGVDRALADVFGSTQGFLGLTGRFPVMPSRQVAGAPAVECSAEGTVDSTLGALSRWAMRQVRIGNGGIPDPYSPGSTDWNATAIASLALVSAGYGRTATRQAVRSLQDHVDDYVGSSDGDRPAALGTLLQVSHAAGIDPRRFGGSDLAARLLATMRR